MKTTHLAYEARRMFSYQPDGTLIRRVAHGGKPPGAVVGSAHHDGYVQTKFRGLNFQVHRIVWLMHHGDLPDVLDHINGDRADNRIENLRSVTRAMNRQNLRSATRINRTGFLGVTLVARNKKRPFLAAIKVDGKRRELGYFEKPELAHEAYVTAKRKFHPGCTL